MTRGRSVLVLTAAAALLVLPAPAEAALRWRSCDGLLPQCARLSVPLDRSGGVRGSLSLHVVREPALRRNAKDVTLLLGGEPGESATYLFGTYSLGGQVVETLRYMVPRSHVLAFDLRGTGKSGPLRCRDLEAATPTDAGREAEACATLLGPRRGLYRTSDTVEDIEALRAELGVERLTLVGMSYGGYVAQQYALRYPERVERLILSSPVDAAGLDPFGLDSFSAVRRMLPLVCRKGCAGFTRDPLGDAARLSEQLARQPLDGHVVGLDGRPRASALTPEQLLFTVRQTDRNPISRMDFPAAVAAALAGDTAPLFRLKRRAVLSSKRPEPGEFSAATRAAVLCEETSFPWGRSASLAERDAATAAAGSLLSGDLVSPFGTRAAIRSELIRLCRHWPAGSAAPLGEPGSMPDVPVLVLARQVDVGSPLETARRAAERFPRADLVVVGSILENPLADGSDCVRRALRRFFAGQPVSGRCPRFRPFIRPGKPPPTSLRELDPVRGVRGARGRLLRAFELTMTDWFDELMSAYFVAPSELQEAEVARGAGLRGGRWVIGPDTARLHRYEFIPGVRVSLAGSGRDEEEITARLAGPGRLDGRLRVVSNGDDQDALGFRVRGRLAGRRVKARLHVGSRVLELLAGIDEEDEGGGGGGGAVRESSAAGRPSIVGPRP